MVALIWISKGKGDPKALFTLSSEALIRTAQVRFSRNCRDLPYRGA